MANKLPDALPDTAIAASNNGSNINVYFQAVDGSIFEHAYRVSSDSGSPSWHLDSDPTVKAGVAKIFTPLAAHVEYGRHYTPQRHLIFVDKHNLLREVYLSGDDWKPGTLDTLQIEVAPCSQLAMVSSKLYYQGTDDVTSIFSVTLSSGQWTKDSLALNTTAAPLMGTGLAAANGEWFSQSYSSTILTSGLQPSETENALPRPSSHTGLAAVGDGSGYKCIFYITKDSKLHELRITKDGQKSTYITSVSPRSYIAAVRQTPSDGHEDVINIFCQTGEGNKISQYKYTHPEGWRPAFEAI